MVLNVSGATTLRSCQSLHLLLVEDDPDDASLIRRTIQRSGLSNWKLVQVERLSEAIAICQDYQELTDQAFDLVLLDLRLPDSSSLNTLFQFRNAVPTLPIVVLTGLDDEMLALRAIQLGAQDYLMKETTSIQQLIQSVRFAIERSVTLYSGS